jgi:hypothetical protein
MTSLWKSVLVAAGGAAIGVALTLAVARPAGGASGPFEPARMPDGKPDLNGVWQALTSANWDLQDHAAQAQPGPWLQLGAVGAIPPGHGVVEGGEIPYRPEALARKRANFEQRLTPATADPEAKCYLPGVPRATYLPHPFQIVQGTAKIAIVYGFADANRTIHMDKPKPEEAPVDSWMGRSHGRWEGNTLVVDVGQLNGQTWLDRAGNFTSENVRVVERYTPRSADHILYEATIEDATVFTRPWKISFPLYRRLEADARLLDFKCVRFSEHLLYSHLRSQPAGSE